MQNGELSQVEQRQKSQSPGSRKDDIAAGPPRPVGGRVIQNDLPHAHKEKQPISQVKAIGDELMPEIVPKAEVKDQGGESEDASDEQEAVVEECAFLAVKELATFFCWQSGYLCGS